MASTSTMTSTSTSRAADIHCVSPKPVIAHVLHRLHLAGAEVLAADLARKLSDRYRFVFLCLDAVGTLGEKLRGEGYALSTVSTITKTQYNTVQMINVLNIARGRSRWGFSHSSAVVEIASNPM